jgi:rhodanese-related sulfurtransferase
LQPQCCCKPIYNKQETKRFMTEFLSNNILMVAVFLMSGVMLIWPELQRAFFGAASEASTLDATRMMNNDALVLDVRDNAAFTTAHLPRAKNIPLGDLDKRVDEISKFKEKPVLIVCESGLRSRAASRLLKAKQFTQVSSLKGGFAEWQKAALPVEKK